MAGKGGLSENEDQSKIAALRRYNTDAVHHLSVILEQLFVDCYPLSMNLSSGQQVIVVAVLLGQ